MAEQHNLVVGGRVSDAVYLPALISREGRRASTRFLEFFTVNIRNPNTRLAYAKAVGQFLSWCDQTVSRGVQRSVPLSAICRAFCAVQRYRLSRTWIDAKSSAGGQLSEIDWNNIQRSTGIGVCASQHRLLDCVGIRFLTPV